MIAGGRGCYELFHIMFTREPFIILFVKSNSQTSSKKNFCQLVKIQFYNHTWN